MLNAADLELKTSALLEELRAKFGVRAKTVQRAMRKVGRRVPARLHKQAAVIVAAHKLGGNPKLMRQVDEGAVSRAFELLQAHLETIDVRKRRTDRILDVLGSVSFNLIVLCAVMVVFLRWRGVL